MANNVLAASEIRPTAHSTKVKKLLCYRGFQYSQHSRKGENQYWRCVEGKVCNARCHTNADLDNIAIVPCSEESLRVLTWSETHQHQTADQQEVRDVPAATAQPGQQLRKLQGEGRGHALPGGYCVQY